MTALLAEDRTDTPAGSRRAAESGGSPGGSRFAGMRTRVLVSFLILLTLSTAASLFVLREVLISRIDDEVERSLQEEVSKLERLSERGEDPRTGRPFEGGLAAIFDLYFARFSPASDGANVAFLDGEVYRARSSAPDRAGLVDELERLASTSEPRSGELETPAGPALYVAVPVSTESGQTGVLGVAQLLGEEHERVGDAVRIAVGVSIVVLLLASLFIWLAAGRAVAPLKELEVMARAISESDLTRRIPVRGGDEIAALGRTFNEMLDRLETAFGDQKEFLADVSHELRTPITVIRGHLETLGDDPDERAEAVTVIQDELDRMNRFVDDLLLLVRASRPDFLRPEPVDLDLLTQDVFAKARLLGDRDWSLAETGVGLVRADPHRLVQAVMNLAENAVRHTRPGQRIWLGSSMDDGNARLWVRDEGPGVDPADQRLIFERFAHSHAASAPGGAGLGLAIVKAVAEAHEGRVELQSEPGEGSTFAIVIPAGNHSAAS